MSKRLLVSKQILLELRKHMNKFVPDLKEILEDWPDANRKLKFPALTIFTGAPVLTYTLSPNVLNTPDKSTPAGVPVEGKAQKKFPTKHVIGRYDLDLQLDFWCRDKEQRHKIYEDVIHAMNPKAGQTLGLSLQLNGYHGVFCHYVTNGYDYSDDEAAAQRREWRLRVPVLANTNAVIEKDESLILDASLDPSSEFGENVNIEG